MYVQCRYDIVFKGGIAMRYLGRPDPLYLMCFYNFWQPGSVLYMFPIAEVFAVAQIDVNMVWYIQSGAYCVIYHPPCCNN